MNYFESNQFVETKYPLTRFLENGNLRWPDIFDYEEAETFVFAGRLCSSLTSFEKVFYFNKNDENGLLDHNSLILRDWSFCEILVSATVYYLESLIDVNEKISSFRWDPIIILLFESNCSLLLFVTLKQLKYPQYSTVEFISSVNRYLIRLEKNLVWQEKTNKINFQFIPTKKHCTRVLNLVLVNECLVKQLIDTIFMIEDAKSSSTCFNSLRVYLETLINTSPTNKNKGGLNGN